MYLSQPIPGDTAMFFIWVVLYSAYFFDPARTAAQIAIIAVAYGATLCDRSRRARATPRAGSSRWGRW